MKELKAGDKIVQQMTRDGAVEVNKATGGAANISAGSEPDNQCNRDSSVSEDVIKSGGDSMQIIGGVAGRVSMERQAAKKRMVRKANAEIYERSRPKPEKSRLQFSDAERTDPAMAKSVRKADKAANRYESRLVFGEKDKPANGKFQHALDRPKREAAAFIHKEVSKHEGDNTGIQAAHSAEKTAEYGARKLGDGYRYLKFAPHRAAFRAEEKLIKANSKALYQRSLRLNPELRNANPIKRAWHKRRIKREYARAFRAQGQKGVQAAAGTAKRTVRGVGSAIIRTIKTVKAKKPLPFSPDLPFCSC